MDEPTWPEMRPEDPFEIEQAQEGPKRIVGVGRYHLSRYDKFGAFEFSDGSLGATGPTGVGVVRHCRVHGPTTR